MCVCYNLHSSPSKSIIPTIRCAVLEILYKTIDLFCGFNHVHAMKLTVMAQKA